MYRNIKLTHCVVNGNLYHVSAFAHIRPRLRPTSYCPACLGKVVLKLGKSGKPIHHAAHKPNSTCHLTNPEGILHYYSKLHIFEQLKQGAKLLLPQKCKGWESPTIFPYKGGPCACIQFKSDKEFMWLEDWDDVRLEQFVGNWKADIVIYRKEEPIAIIEICATHQMDESKRLGYSELNIQWVEVEASEKIFLIDDTVGRLWNIGTPLQYKVCEPVVPTFICEDCIKAPEFYRQEVESRLEKERCERLAASREKREKKKRCLNYLTRHNYIVNAKSLCFLCDDGYLEYHELIAYERCAEKSPFERLEIYIKDGEKGDIIASEEAPITDESKRRLKDNLRRWQSSKSLRSKRINITDSWVSFDDVERLRQTWKPPFVWNWEKKVWIPK